MFYDEEIRPMANVRGKRVKTDKIDFSFYFSSNYGINHAIRVKFCFNPDRITHEDFDGCMELHGNYEWIPNRRISSRQISSRQIEDARNFFKKYSVLFNSVLNGVLYEGYLQDYFKGEIDFNGLISKYEVSEDSYQQIQKCANLKELSVVLNTYENL